MSVLPTEIIQLCATSATSLRQMKIGEKNEINVSQFRLFISSLRACREDVALCTDGFRELFTALLDVLASGILLPDNEIILFTALCIFCRRTLSVEENCKFLNECISAKHSLSVKVRYLGNTFNHTVIIKKEFLYRACLCSSILQCYDVDSFREFYDPCYFPANHCPKNSFLLIFEILENDCNKLFSSSYLFFKSMMTWLFRLNELFRSKLIDLSLYLCYLRRVLFVVNCNWENQAAVVRNKNLEIMKFLVSMCPVSFHSENDVLNLLHDVGITLQHLSWRVKRKYFMLIAVLPKFGVKKALENFPEICEGLVHSLSHPHLVSVGTNLYREVMKGIQFDDWQRFFFHPVKEMLFGTNRIAKENFMSHWMPETLESYSVLLESLLTENGNTSLLLPLLSLYKIGRKCDLLSWEEMNKELICNCLHHLNEWIRIEAFAVVCASTKTTVPPTSEEIEMVCTFIEENINGDNARVRQQMVKSFKNLLTRVRDSYNSSFENKLNTMDRKLIMHWIRMFITDCNKPGSNYQRKITSLYLLRDIFELSSKKNCPKGQKVNASIKSFEEKIAIDFKSKDVFSLLLESISYPADDVRDLGCSILMENFEPPSDEVLQNLWENALRNCSSSMFYEVECGAVFAELFAYWEIERHGLRDSFDFFEVMLLRAEKQLTETTENLLKSATEGAIHGTLGILLRMLSNSHIYAKIKVKEDQMRRLLHLLHHLIAYLIGILSSRKKSNNAPSFEEMSQAIKSIILRNEKEISKTDLKKQNDAYELLVNCIWLNLKMSCLLASAIGKGFGKMGGGETLKEEDVEKCAQMITFVLLNCRHKGVIESAGGAIFSLASFCSRNSNPKLKFLPSKLVQQCMDVAFKNGGCVGGTSITRRSAGLAILLHKLVAADAQNILPVCVSELLSEASLGCEASNEPTETEDLPHTRALHFLKAIVEDSSLFNSVAQFMSEIAIICIKSFSSRIWAIRNAALLLFGPVVSRLVTQNGVEECEGCITLEELKAHYPHLVDFILMELQKAVNWGEDTFGMVSPSLIPILSLCSRISIGMLQLHSESFKKILSEFHVVFIKLLSSPIIAVRKLSAKAISSFTSLVEIPSQISLHISSLDESMSKNNVHGKLICISMLNEKFTFNSYLIPIFSKKSIEMNNLIKEIKLTNMDSKTSLFVQSLLYEMQGCNEEEMVNFFGDENKSWFPGMKLQSALTIDSCIMSCPENIVCDIIRKTKHSLACLEMSLDSLIKRIESSHFSKITTENITELLIELFDTSFPPNLLTLFLRSIHLLTKSSSSITISESKLKSVFIPLLSFSKYGTACAAEALLFVTFFAIKNLASKKESNVVTDLALNLKERSSPKNCEEMRRNAGKALIHFSPLFDDTKRNLEEHVEIKACVIHSAVSLLQDENTDVRKEAAICVSNLMYVKGISMQQMDFSPQYCLKLIFSNIAQLLPLKDAMEFLWNLLINDYSLSELMNRRMSSAVCNPFSHGVSNVYAEKVIITSIAGKTLFSLIEINSDAFKITLAKEEKRIIDEAVAIDKFLTLHGSDQLYTNLEEYLALVKIKTQLKALIQIESSTELLSLYLKLEKCSPDGGKIIIDVDVTCTKSF